MLEDEKMTDGFEGTVGPVGEFSAEVDAKRFYHAMKGAGTDEDGIMRIVAGRSNSQLKQIAAAFKVCYGEELIPKIKGELTGTLEKACVRRMYNRHELAAMRCRAAMKGMGTSDKKLIEQIVTKSPADIEQLKTAYETMFEGRNLEKDVKSETRGDYEKLLISVLSGGREDEKEVDHAQARNEAQVLYDAGEGKWGTDESTFNRIMCTRSWAQLRATFHAYKECSNKTIEEAIKSEMGGDLETAMLSMVSAAKNIHLHYAKLIHEAMKGMGTDDDKLVQYIVERCEIDMVQVKKEFQHKYEKSLASWIKEDVGGDARTILLGLIGDVDLGEFEAGYGQEE